MTVRILCCILLIALATKPTTAFAQADGDQLPPGATVSRPPEQPLNAAPAERRPWGQVRFGKLWLTPSVSLKEFGVDTNVFNSSIADESKSDIYAIAGPDLTLLLDTKRLRVDVVGSADYVHYLKTVTERSFQLSGSAEARFQLSKRLELSAAGSDGSTRQRFSPEIDARVRHRARTLSVGASVAITRRMAFDMTAGASERRFDPGAFYNNVQLQQTLNEELRSSGAAVKLSLTPWTQVTFGGRASASRFPFLPSRDADHEKYYVRADMNARALVFGSAEAGRILYRTRASGIADYEGTTANATLGTRFGENTSLRVLFVRDVGLSYEPSVPFTLERRMGAIAQRTLFSRTALILEAHEHRYEYLGFVPTRPGELAPPNERAERFIGRLTVRAGGDFRLGFNSEYLKRHTESLQRQYEGFRFWTSIQYGRLSVRDRNAIVP